MAKAATKSVGSNGSVNRISEHLPASEEPVVIGKAIHIPKLRIAKTVIRIIGETSLICHNFDEKTRKQMLDKQTGAATAGRAKKNVDQLFKDSLYPFPGGGYGFPANAFKLAAVRGATELGLKMTNMRQAFHTEGIQNEAGASLVKLIGKPTPRQDPVRLPGSADIRIRAEFLSWSCDIPVTFNVNTMSGELLLSIFQQAGFSVGIGDWRPEKNGDHGRWRLRMANER